MPKRGCTVRRGRKTNGCRRAKPQARQQNGPRQNLMMSRKLKFSITTNRRCAAPRTGRRSFSANRASDGKPGQERAASAGSSTHRLQASKKTAPPAAGCSPSLSGVRLPAQSWPYSSTCRHNPSAAPRRAAPPPLRAAAQTQPGSIKASCPGCGTIYTNIKPEHIGKYARCKKCETRFLIS